LLQGCPVWSECARLGAKTFYLNPGDRDDAVVVDRRH
jgi:hypothetical protein